MSPYLSVNLPNLRDAKENGKMANRTHAPARYKLMAVIQHIGNEMAGHYFVYRKQVGRINSDYVDYFCQTNKSRLLKDKQQWLMISDCVIREVPEAQVTSAEAYMLFYQRVVNNVGD